MPKFKYTYFPAEYEVHRGIKRRCYMPNRKDYKEYGGRGISMSAAWKSSFMQFISDMGECPEGHTIERVDNDGNYCVENCVWLPKEEQYYNRQDTIHTTINGVTKPFVVWCKEYGVNRKVAYHRMRAYGWSAYDALTCFGKGRIQMIRVRDTL